MAFITTLDGVRLHVRDMGEGRPVVLVHGWPLTGDMFEHQTLALLDAGYRVVTYDRRGFGLSDHAADGYDYNTLCNDLAAVLTALDLRQVSLVGFSMGGGEIARYLTRHGTGRITNVTLIGSVVPFLLKTDDHPQGVDGEVFDGMQAQIRKDRLAFLQGFAPGFYGNDVVANPVSQGVLDWTFRLASMASPRATIACVDAFGRTDFRPDLASFTVPTLIIHGTADATVPIDLTARAAAAAILGATLIEYEGEAHGLFATAAERLNADLLQFIG